MSVILRTVGVMLAGRFAVPIAGISGIAATISFFVFIFSSGNRSFQLFLFFLCAAAVCYLSIKILLSISKRGQNLILNINAKEGLNLNPNNMLGYPSPAFIAFDKESRKLTICNSITGDYKIHDFEYVLRWHYEWATGIRSDLDVRGGAYIPRTGMREPTFNQTEYRKNYKLILEVADENYPILKFQMQGEASAEQWCAKLNAIFNG